MQDGARETIAKLRVFDRLLSLWALSCDVEVRTELFVGRCWKARRRNEYK